VVTAKVATGANIVRNRAERLIRPVWSMVRIFGKFFDIG
jgi:hypothetical protein